MGRGRMKRKGECKGKVSTGREGWEIRSEREISREKERKGKKKGNRREKVNRRDGVT